MLLAGRRFFRTSRTDANSAGAAIVADAVRVVDDDCPVIGIMNDRDVYIAYCTVVIEHSAVPIPARVTDSAVAEAIIDAAVEAHVGTPITRAPHVYAIAPTPITRSPQETGARRHNPCARHPVITIRSPGPIAGGPNKTGFGTDRLRVNRNRWRANPDGNADIYLFVPMTRLAWQTSRMPITASQKNGYCAYASHLEWGYPAYAGKRESV